MSYLQSIRLTAVRMSHFSLLGASTEHIKSVSNGIQWFSVAQVVDQIRFGQQFYVENAAGVRAYVEVVPRLGQPAYIRTHRDGTVTDNLLSLPGGPFYTNPLRGLLSFI